MSELKYVCPLTGKKITVDDCFDICMVMEDSAPEWTILDEVKPEITDQNKMKCLRCEWHWM